MRHCKTRFWINLKNNPICDPDHITLTAATQLTKEKKLKAWWEKPGFAEWFGVEDEFEVKVASAKFSALETMIDVMNNPDTPASARVAAAKTVIDQAKQAEKDDGSLEELLKQISGVKNIEDLQKYLK